MTTMTRTYDAPASAARGSALRRLVAGAAGFDTALGVFCLAAASKIGDWLSVSTADVRVAGGLALLAAVVGAVTAGRAARDARAIAGANVAFALWALAMLSGDPDALGIVLLLGSATTAAGTAFAELRLAASE